MADPEYLGGVTAAAFRGPELNPKASEALVLSIKQDPALRIRLRVESSTHNPECSRQSWPGAPKTSLTHEEVIQVPANKDNTEIVILLDKFRPGACKWGVGSIAMNVEQSAGASSREGSWDGFLVFGTGGVIMMRSPSIAFTCRSFNPKKTQMSCWEKELKTGIVGVPPATRKLSIYFSVEPVSNADKPT